MGDEKAVAEAAVQLVKQLALACASLIVGREKGLLSDANLDVARLNEWSIRSPPIARRLGRCSTPSSGPRSSACDAKPNGGGSSAGTVSTRVS
jgi:hypothetical protein